MDNLVLCPSFTQCLDFASLSMIVNEVDKRTYNLEGVNFDTWIKHLYFNGLTGILTDGSDGNLISSLETFQIQSKYLALFMLRVTPNNIAMLLKVLRKQRQYSLRDLSEITGFSKTSISHRESNELMSFPNMTTIKVYLEAFNISLKQFLFLLFLYEKTN